MSELVGRGADTAHRVAKSAPHFRGAEIPAQILIVKTAAGIALVRPDRIGATAFGLVVAGIVHQDHIDGAVVVGIVLTEIDLVIEQLAGLLQSLLGARRLVVSIVLARLGQRHRAIHFEHRLVSAVGILVVIIPDGTGCAVRGIAFLVEHVGESSRRIVDDKRLVAEIHKDDRNPVATLRKGLGGLRAHLTGGAPHLGGFLLFFLRRLLGRPVETVGVLGDDTAVLVRDVMEPFVAMDLDDDGRTVRLLHPDLSRIGRNGGKGIEGTHEECEGYKDLSHGYWIWTMKPVPPSAISQALPSSSLTTVTVKSSAWVAACLI